jgi:hypothetical protein
MENRVESFSSNKKNGTFRIAKMKVESAQAMTGILLMCYPVMLVVDGLALSAWANHLKTKMLKTWDQLMRDPSASLDLSFPKTKLSQFGSVVWAVFDFVQHSLQPLSRTSLDAIAFARKVGAALHLEQIEFRMGITFEADARAGITSRDRLLFDLYSAVISTAATLARREVPASGADDDDGVDCLGHRTVRATADFHGCAAYASRC